MIIESSTIKILFMGVIPFFSFIFFASLSLVYRCFVKADIAGKLNLCKVESLSMPLVGETIFGFIYAPLRVFYRDLTQFG